MYKINLNLYQLLPINLGERPTIRKTNRRFDPFGFPFHI